MKPIVTLTDDEFENLVQGAVALPDAPPVLVRSAVALFRDAQPSPLMAATEKVLQRILAVLTFDSWAVAPTALGLRSMPAQSATRHMLFSAKGRDIDLRIVSAADSYVLAGQILGPDDSGMVELSVDTYGEQATLSTRKVALDELGGFLMNDVHAGTYWMTLKLGNDAVELPPIDVGERSD
jgi:hypothetical protein